MKHEQLAEALDQIRNEYIAEAAQPPKRRYLPWVSAVAALVALTLTVALVRPGQPAPGQLAQPTEAVDPQQYLLAQPQYPQVSDYPVTYTDSSYDAWRNDQAALHNQPEGYADNLQAYFAGVIPTLMGGREGENVTCSPVSLYMALAMLAETTGGESRAQILQLLQADSIEALRTQAGQVWKAHYNDDGITTSLLATSLWLHEAVEYKETTVNAVAEYYYASVFRGALGSEEMNGALRGWLNENTGGLLQDQVGQVSLSPNSTLAIASTVLYQDQWLTEFRSENNTQETFHGPAGQTQETFMHRELTYGPYYQSDNFGAVYLDLESGGRMWLLLPREGVTPESLLSSGEVTAFFGGGRRTEQRIIVDLSVPKFDVAADMDFVAQLKLLGITDIFQPGVADFSNLILLEDGGYVSQVKHAARVTIDEKGVTAAAFTVIDRCGAAMPPTERITFTLDRPFLFYIESQDGLPLFAGIVNEP